MATKGYQERFDTMDVDQWTRNKMEILSRNHPAGWLFALKTIVHQNMSREEVREYLSKRYLAHAPRMPDIDCDVDTH